MDIRALAIASFGSANSNSGQVGLRDTQAPSFKGYPGGPWTS